MSLCLLAVTGMIGAAIGPKRPTGAAVTLEVIDENGS
jgi:hypothetical protein